jgi:hypothetical protein
MYGEAIVLDQNRLRRQLIPLHQFRDRFSAARINFFAIQ